MWREWLCDLCAGTRGPLLPLAPLSHTRCCTRVVLARHSYVRGLVVPVLKAVGWNSSVTDSTSVVFLRSSAISAASYFGDMCVWVGAVGGRCRRGWW